MRSDTCFTNLVRVNARRRRIWWFSWHAHAACMGGQYSKQSAGLASCQMFTYKRRTKYDYWNYSLKDKWVNKTSNLTLSYTQRWNKPARVLYQQNSSSGLSLSGICVVIKWKRPKRPGYDSWEAPDHLLVSLPCFGHYCRIPSPDLQPHARYAAVSQLPWLQGQGNNLAP